MSGTLSTAITDITNIADIAAAGQTFMQSVVFIPAHLMM